MTYTTRNTVKRLARNELNLNPVDSKEGINLYIELQEHKLDQIAARNRISLDKPIAL